MKVILSRKGFDSKNGGMPSPIVDGAMLSMPIPSPGGANLRRFSDLKLAGRSYLSLLQELRPSFTDNCCHLDPDIRPGLTDRADWLPAFGQVEGAQTHLENEGVGIGDLFLFFGWFRDVAARPDGRLKYSGPHMQAVFGYLQIGEVLKGNEIAGRCPWHPHAEAGYARNNTLYLAADALAIDGVPTGSPGYGVLPFRADRVLTKPGESRSKWTRLPWMEHARISHHGAKNLKDGYFKSADIGQEFVIQDDAMVCAWAEKILRD